jgi:hypothetical protein
MPGSWHILRLDQTMLWAASLISTALTWPSKQTQYYMDDSRTQYLATVPFEIIVLAQLEEAPFFMFNSMMYLICSSIERCQPSI